MYSIGDVVQVPAFVFGSSCGADAEGRVRARVVDEGGGVLLVQNDVGQTAAIPPAHCTAVARPTRRGRRKLELAAEAAKATLVDDFDSEARAEDEDLVVDADADADAYADAYAELDEGESTAATEVDSDSGTDGASEDTAVTWRFCQLVEDFRADWWPSEADFAAMSSTFRGDVARFLPLLAASISLSPAEKKRILDSMPLLSARQVASLTEIFEDEAKKFEEVYRDGRRAHVGRRREVERLCRAHALQWLELCAQRWPR